MLERGVCHPEGAEVCPAGCTLGGPNPLDHHRFLMEGARGMEVETYSCASGHATDILAYG